MKRCVLFGALILMLAGSVLLGQETQKPYSYTFAGEIGDCTFTGVSLDQVWVALAQAFITHNNEGDTPYGLPAVSDRSSESSTFSMDGRWGYMTWFEVWRPIRLYVRVERGPGGIGVYCITKLGDIMLKGKGLKDTASPELRALVEKHDIALVAAFDDECKVRLETAFFEKVVEFLYGKAEK